MENRVAPSQDDGDEENAMPLEDYYYDEDEEEDGWMPMWRQVPYLEASVDFIQSLTIGRIKAAIAYFLDTASIEFNIKFDDIMMAMTVFVLFATDINIAVGYKSLGMSS